MADSLFPIRKQISCCHSIREIWQSKGTECICAIDRGLHGVCKQSTVGLSMQEGTAGHRVCNKSLIPLRSQICDFIAKEHDICDKAGIELHCLQALQRLWEPARFTYQVNNPSSQTQRPAVGSKRSAAVIEHEEADSSSSDDQGCLAQPQQASQIVTRGAETRGEDTGTR